MLNIFSCTYVCVSSLDDYLFKSFARFWFCFWLCCAACRILVPWPDIKPDPQQWERWVQTTGLSGNFSLAHFLKFIIFIKGYLLYRIFLFSVKPQHESAIGVHISHPFWTSFPSPFPSHPSRLIQSPCLSFLIWSIFLTGLLILLLLSCNVHQLMHG